MRRISYLAFSSILALAACGEPQLGEQHVTPDDSSASNAERTQTPPAGTEACFEIDMSTALRDVCVLSADSMAGRLVGTEGNAMARSFLVERFEAIGLEPVGDSFAHAFDFERLNDRRNPDAGRQSLTGYNLIGRIPGLDSSRAIAVTAHYDHVGPGENNEIFNGADDNASGVGAILAIAEHFKANPPAHDILIVAFDAEEGGLYGARAYVEEPPAGAPPVALVFNLDMVSYSPDGDIWAAGSYHTPGLLPIIEAVDAQSPIDLKAGYDRPRDQGGQAQDWTLMSDHAPFHRQGAVFLYLGVEDHEHYHRPSDEFGIIDPAFYNGVVALSIDLAERLDESLTGILESVEAGN